MKKTLTAFLAAMAIATAAVPSAARHRAASPSATIKIHQSNNADGTPSGTTAIVAFSDTASVDTADVDTADVDTAFFVSHGGVPNAMLEELSKAMDGAAWPITAVLVIFFLAPVAIIALLIYYIIKSRKQKIQLAELAMRSGQPLPPSVIAEYGKQRYHRLWEKGLTKVFVGIGIVVFSVFIGSDFFKGAGFLVAFYGAGQAAVAFTSKKKDNGLDDINPKDGETLS